MRLFQVLLTLVLLLSAASYTVFSSSNGKEDEKFAGLVDEYLELTWQNSPLAATFAGVHKYDDRIDRYTVAGAKEDLEKQKKFIERFKTEIDRSKLTESNQIDYDLMLSSVKESEFDLYVEHHLERSPGTYPGVIAALGFLMFTREYAPFEERMENLVRRMEQMPQILEDGKKNLSNPPQLWTKIAIETTKGAIGLYSGIIGPAFTNFPKDPRMRYEAVNAKLVAALQSYQEFLEKDLLPRSNGTFADGRENFVYRLKNFYELDQSPEEIKAMAQQVLEKTKTDMDEIARQVDSNKKWWEVLEDAKRKHFPAEEVIPAYQRTTARARQWVLDKKLASIPEEKLEVIETPQFRRFVVPYAAYIPPAPFEKEQKGFYNVTPVDTSLSKEAQEGQLGELYIDIENTTVHEAYPGHHLQFIHQNRLSKIRRLNDTSLMSEGWGLYCERLADEFGFYSTPIDRLEADRWLLVRAVRVLVDVGMHCEGMTYDEAVNLMLEHAKLERAAAEGEVRRYTQSPTQPLSYLMGMLAIYQLRDQYRQVKRDHFSIQDFHDTLLSYGAIPLKIIRNSMFAK